MTTYEYLTNDMKETPESRPPDTKKSPLVPGRFVSEEGVKRIGRI